ncbi:alpha/beta hydrolase family protein [Marimonas arenosa]|uniref:Alpha/beta hydrolase n=1 Tax=Marimonas arenosa TaxID=1795305 RepID=A0AAE3WD09_9RHOB|nr:hypothetical protein [Marimonas arenosa]MDQ2090459.1 hypothetical protein [Marimonas arenosa]
MTRADGVRVPIMEFIPDATDCPPLLVLSHGFGGSEQGLTWLAHAAVNAGFHTITMGHRESGRSQLRTVLRSADRRAALAAAVEDRAANAARLRDLDAVWSHATRDCRPGFAALAGHSMGAQLTMIEAGAENAIGVRGKDRFDAYVALSPQGVGRRFPRGAWAGIGRPVLMVTGTRDAGLEGDWRHRLGAFDGLPPGDKWLAVLDGGTHMDIGGRGRPRLQRNVIEIVLAFLGHMGKPRAKDMPALAGVRYRTK